MFSVGGDRFELLHQVGQGGYGVVYKARDLRDQRDVAIKLMQDLGRSADSRFEREAALLAELHHPAIVHYVAHGKSPDGQPYLVMEWLEGETLQDRMARTLLPLDDTLRLAMRVVAALVYAAGKGVIHRDIKPGNLFLVGGQLAEIKVLDFGLAKRIADRQQLTRTGLLVGTPLYMSPEQARGEHDIDTRTDIFSLASVLYEGLAGQPPFEAFNDLTALAKVCFDDPLPLDQLVTDIPAPLVALLSAMHAKERDKRPGYPQIAEELSRIAQLTRASGGGSSGNARLPGPSAAALAPTMSLRADGQQRVLCAVFVSPPARRDASAAEPSGEHEPALRELAAACHARLERLLDGTLVLLLESQLAAGEQAVAAGQAALQVRELLPQAALLICMGRALTGPLPFGELFERAKTMLADIPPGETHVDEASAAQLDSRFELSGPPGRRCLQRERHDGEAPRTVLGHNTVFVGRERELQNLQLLFDECVDERVARAALVVAPAGAGKSRLRFELVERLRSTRQLKVLTARGDAMRIGTPFGLLTPALRSWAKLASNDTAQLKREKLRAQLVALLGPSQGPQVSEFLGEMLGLSLADQEARGAAREPRQESPALLAARRDPQLMADRVLESWLTWLEALCAASPVLLCIEDLHWSDPGSLRFLEASLSSLRSAPLLVVGFARPELREMYPNLWAERDLTELRLPKLPARACEQLLSAIAEPDMDARMRRYLLERADGNPFFLEELVRGVKERADQQALPDTILGIVQARLDGLGEEPKLLIRAASVFGEVFRVEGVRELLGGDGSRFDFASWLALLVDREVVFRRGTVGQYEYVFRHALIRDAAYLLLPDSERALGHKLAAQWLEQQADVEPALLADHFERAGVPAKAAVWYCAAATASLEAGSLEDVVRCGERAATCGAQGSSLGEVAAAMAEALSFSGDDARAVTWAETARSALPIGVPAWWRASQVAAITYLRGNSDQLPPVLAQMLEHSPLVPTMPEQVIALSYLAGECIRTLQHELAQRVLALIPRELPAELGGRAQGCIDTARANEAWGHGNLSGALHHARRALLAFRAAGAIKDVAGLLNLNGYLLLELGCHDDAERTLEEEVQLGQRIGSHNDVWSGTQNLGVSYLARGQLEQAEQALLRSAEGFERIQMVSFQVLSLVHLAAVHLRRNELSKADSLLTSALARQPIEDAPRALGHAMQARLELLRGSPERALQRMEEPAGLLESERVLEYVATIRLAHIDSLIACERRTEAAGAVRAAYRWLAGRAAQIEDLALRESFWGNVPDHARIVALFQVWSQVG